MKEEVEYIGLIITLFIVIPALFFYAIYWILNPHGFWQMFAMAFFDFVVYYIYSLAIIMLLKVWFE